MKEVYTITRRPSLICLILFFLMISPAKAQVNGVDNTIIQTKTESSHTTIDVNEELRYVVVTGSLVKISANSLGEVIVYEKSPAISEFPKFINTGNLESDINNYKENKSNWIKIHEQDLEAVLKNEIKIPMSIKKNVYRTK